MRGYVYIFLIVAFAAPSDASDGGAPSNVGTPADQNQQGAVPNDPAATAPIPATNQNMPPGGAAAPGEAAPTPEGAIVPPRQPEPTTPAPSNDAETVPPTTLDTARINFPTVVESYLARHTHRGVWMVKDTSGRTWRLQWVKTDSDSVRDLGNGLFATSVLFRTAGPPIHRVQFDFTVDFKGDYWHVTQYRLYKIDGKDRK